MTSHPLTGAARTGIATGPRRSCGHSTCDRRARAERGTSLVLDRPNEARRHAIALSHCLRVGPLHLIRHLPAFALFGWASSQILGGGSVINCIGRSIRGTVRHDLGVPPL